LPAAPLLRAGRGRPETAQAWPRLLIDGRFCIHRQAAAPAARQALEDLAAQHEAGGARADARVARLARLIQEHRSLAKVLNDFSSSLERHAGPGARVTPGCQARAQALLTWQARPRAPDRRAGQLSRIRWAPRERGRAGGARPPGRAPRPAREAVPAD
jgi:hypothetical protein